MPGQSDDDVTRRTRLAAERTWLAWWRSGVAGYAVLAAAMFVGAALRRRAVGRALERGGFADVSDSAVLAVTLVSTVLALGTLC